MRQEGEEKAVGKPEGVHHLVLDIETRADPLAAGIAGVAGAARRPAMQRVVAAAALLARRGPDAMWTDLRLLSWDIDDGAEAVALIEIGRLLDQVHAKAGHLVTYNGTAHDLPVLRRRAAAHWLFEHRGLTVWSGAAAGRHIDLMADGAQPGERWPSLVEACAGLGLALEPEEVHPRFTPAPLAVRKAQSDVVGTFLLLLHRLSLENGSLDDVARGWTSLADMLLADHGNRSHLAGFRHHGRLNIAREHLARRGSSATG